VYVGQKAGAERGLLYLHIRAIKVLLLELGDLKGTGKCESRSRCSFIRSWKKKEVGRKKSGMSTEK